ncbi:MAG: hypothetical protein ACTHKR_04485 [Sphingomonas sp.]
MATTDTVLFHRFAETLNRELTTLGSTLRVACDVVPPSGTMMLQDAGGHDLGSIPDRVDAETIRAFEAMILSRRRA